MKAAEDRFEIVTGAAARDGEDFERAVREGLAGTPKSLPSRFLYDDEGSRLFEEICEQPEYYLTRVEGALLEDVAGELAGHFSGTLELVELGSGTAEKTEALLRAFSSGGRELCYVPVDISRDVLERSGERLIQKFPELTVLALEAEYNESLRLLAERDHLPKLVCWLGSSIGNLRRPAACAFLARLREWMNPEDRLLLGIDLRKDKAVLEAAYDDAAGVTARFNLNLLARINRELGGHFDTDAFAYEACYDEEGGSVEMLQVSRRAQAVRVDALERSFDFAEGERIHIECSLKYSAEEIEALARSGGYDRIESWQDAERQFSLTLLAPAQ